MMMYGRRLAKAVKTAGVMMHGGGMAAVTLQPVSAGAGMTLVRTDLPDDAGEFVLGQGAELLVQSNPLATVLKNAKGGEVSTVEHLMAALAGLGVSDIRIAVDGPELPILDGSALPWVMLLDEAGLVDGADVAAHSVAQETIYEDKGRRFVVTPGDDWRLTVSIDFAHADIGAQRFGGLMTEEFFRREIAPARTFIVEKDLKTAQAWGKAKGATLDGGVLFLDAGGVANPEGLRFADEPVRHKLLDALGDLYITGRPWRGSFEMSQPGHAATNQLVRKLLG